MKLLLDTHLLLWWLSGSPSLSKTGRTLIADPDHAIFVSAVTLWEIRLKESLDKLNLPVDFEARLNGEAFEPLPLTAAHVHNIASLPWHHRDPFDRMLVAQARAERMRLLTTDEQLAAYGDAVMVVK